MIPQLVRLMTKLDHNDAELASGAEGARQRGTALERRKLAEDNRKLAESAGQMLYTLIIEGTPEVRAATMAVEQRACCAECAMLAPISFRRHIVDAHRGVATGARAHHRGDHRDGAATRKHPARGRARSNDHSALRCAHGRTLQLMVDASPSLSSDLCVSSHRVVAAAEEQLDITQNGDDPMALQSALEFGRWIKARARRGEYALRPQMPPHGVGAPHGRCRRQ